MSEKLKVNRKVLLDALEYVSPGLTVKELLEQSSCVVFKDGRVYTFNDEIACRFASPLGDALTGAVVAKPLMELLSRLTDEEIYVSTIGDDNGMELCVASAPVQGKKERRRAKFAMQAKALLPIDSIEQPEVWHPMSLPSLGADQKKDTIAAAFGKAVNMVAACASKNSKEFVYSCIHVRGGECGFIEACDRLQIARYPLSLPISSSDLLIRAASLQQIASIGVHEVSETASWLHFRNERGVVFSCRKFVDAYTDLGRFIDKEGSSKIVLPLVIDEILLRAGIFSAAASVGSFVIVDIKPGQGGTGVMTISGKGPFGEYDEQWGVTYTGKEAATFLIAPQLLLELAKKSSDCHILPGKLFVDSPEFYYFTCTNSPDLLKPVETKTATDAAT